MSTGPIVPLEDADLGAAAAALGEAFQDDPLACYMWPDPAERAARLPGHFTPFLRYGRMFGDVLTTAGRPRGAAVWLGPDAWDITPERAAAAGIDALPSIMGETAAERFFSTVGEWEPFHHRDVPAAHWYLFLIGVAPDAQGLGLGRALTAPVMARADAAGQPCYLETTNSANVPFYAHLGFRCLVHGTTNGVPVWTFRRDPPSPHAEV